MMVPVGVAFVLFEELLREVIVPVVAALVAVGMPKSIGGRLRETLITDGEVRMNEPVSASTEVNQPDTLAVEKLETAEELEKAYTAEPEADGALFRNRRSGIL